MLRKLGLGALVGTGVFGIFIGVLLLALIFALPAGWLLMIVIGIVHSYAPAVPALGFWVSYLILVLLRMAFGSISASTSN